MFFNVYESSLIFFFRVIRIIGYDSRKAKKNNVTATKIFFCNNNEIEYYKIYFLYLDE